MTGEFEVYREVEDKVVRVDLASASINDLQDSYLWDWVQNQLVRLAKRRGLASAGEAYLLFWMSEMALASSDTPGGASVLVFWLMAEVER